MQTQKIEYYDGDILLEGYCAYINNHTQLPAVLVAHDWSGRNDFACQKAEKLAELGYVGFALDMYGKGKTGKTNEEKMALMNPLVHDRMLLQTRIQAAFNAVKKISYVNPAKIAAIGFCFGGLCVLDLARSGAELKGVVSFHGLLNAQTPTHAAKITARILALHGHQDPMVPPEHVLAFETEMTKAGVDWQMHIYGQAQHAFSNPVANDTTHGLIYNANADRRAWNAMQYFLAEIL